MSKKKRNRKPAKLTRIEKADIKTLTVIKNSRQIIRVQQRHVFILVLLLAASIVVNAVQFVWG